jgi:hypothetical protein
MPTGVSATDALTRGRYLLVLGGRTASFVSFGTFGTFRVHGAHAYRQCYDWNNLQTHLVTRGITTIRGLTKLFADALEQD